MPPLRVAFAGTPEFARLALAAIHEAAFVVPLVLTQPDRPAGRGLGLRPSAVKQFALDHALALAQPRSLKLDGKFPADAAAARAALEAAAPDVMVVAAYGLILPPWVLALPRLGCLNIHGSVLPRWRGAAPIQRAIEAGDSETGITLMQMDAGLDTGAMLLVQKTPIAPDDTGATLHDRLASIGARLVVQSLRRLVQGTLPATPQPAEGATYAAKIDKTESAIDWSQSAVVIERRLRAFDPAPGCTARLDDGHIVKLWRARCVRGPGVPDGPGAAGSRLQANGLYARCGDGWLEILELQLPGGKRISGAEFRRRHPQAQFAAGR